jgi:hypothetical protein
MRRFFTYSLGAMRRLATMPHDLIAWSLAFALAFFPPLNDGGKKLVHGVLHERRKVSGVDQRAVAWLVNNIIECLFQALALKSLQQLRFSLVENFLVDRALEHGR